MIKSRQSPTLELLYNTSDNIIMYIIIKINYSLNYKDQFTEKDLQSDTYDKNRIQTNLKVFELRFSINDLICVFAVNANEHAMVIWTRVIEQTDQFVGDTICEQLIFYAQFQRLV